MKTKIPVQVLGPRKNSSIEKLDKTIKERKIPSNSPTVMFKSASEENSSQNLNFYISQEILNTYVAMISKVRLFLG